MDDYGEAHLVYRRVLVHHPSLQAAKAEDGEATASA
jgi:hypothetical protein